MISCVFHIEEPGAQPREVAVKAGMQFGRGPGNDYVISEKSVGTHHFRIIELDPGELYIDDLGSKNSTRIDGGRVLRKGERHPLRKGLVFWAGKTQITVKELREALVVEEAQRPVSGMRMAPKGAVQVAPESQAGFEPAAAGGINFAGAAKTACAEVTLRGWGLGDQPPLPSTSAPGEGEEITLRASGPAPPGASPPAARPETEMETKATSDVAVPGRGAVDEGEPTQRGAGPPGPAPLLRPAAPGETEDPTLRASGPAPQGAVMAAQAASLDPGGLVEVADLTLRAPGLAGAAVYSFIPEPKEAFPPLLDGPTASPAASTTSDGVLHSQVSSRSAGAPLAEAEHRVNTRAHCEQGSSPGPEPHAREPQAIGAVVGPAVHALETLNRLRPRLVVASAGIQRIVEIREPEFSIGRKEEADLTIQQPHVSSIHAVIRFDGKSFSIEDCTSKNRTSVNGVALERGERYKLSSESRLRFGSVEVLFVVDEDDGVYGKQEEAARVLCRLGKVSRVGYSRALRQAREEGRHVGEILLRDTSLQVSDWVEAFKQAQSVPSTARAIALRAYWPLWAALLAIAVTVFVLLAVILC